jgi:hypothetical protein
MRRATTAALLAVLCCHPVFAQMSGVGSPTPTIGATSPLGIPSGSPVPPTGIPMGATELSSPGVSPLSMGASGIPGYGTTCPAAASGLSGMSSSNMTYDGGGMQMGASMPGGAATVETCGTSSSSTAAMSPTAPGGAPRTGIPLGAVQIGNAGVSPEAIFPAPGQSPLMASPPPSMMASPLPPTTMTPSMTSAPQSQTAASPSATVRPFSTMVRPFSRVPTR